MTSGSETLWMDTSISRNQLKSVIARVTRCRTGERYEYTSAGAAWGGRDSIEAIEVQVDGGPWRHATIGKRNGDFAWLLWSFDWTGATPGPHTFVCRAKSAGVEIQPTREELRKRLIRNRRRQLAMSRSIVVENRSEVKLQSHLQFPLILR